jgi:hypothetical protein
VPAASLEQPPGRRKPLTKPAPAGASEARQTVEAIRAAQASAFKSRPVPQLRVIGTPEANVAVQVPVDRRRTGAQPGRKSGSGVGIARTL